MWSLTAAHCPAHLLPHRRLLRLLLISLLIGCCVCIAAADVPTGSHRNRAYDTDRTALTLPSSSSSNPLSSIQMARRGSTAGYLRSLSSKKLRRFLKERSADCIGCVEKADLLERALSVQGWMTADDYVAMDLTPSTHSAATHLTSAHVSSNLPSDEGTIAFITFPRTPAGDRVLGDMICNTPLVNGTVYCHSMSAMQAEAKRAMTM